MANIHPLGLIRVSMDFRAFRYFYRYVRNSLILLLIARFSTVIICGFWRHATADLSRKIYATNRYRLPSYTRPDDRPAVEQND